MRLARSGIIGAWFAGSSTVLIGVLQAVKLIILARLLAPEDFGVMGMAEALYRLANDPDPCARCAAEGRAHVELNFDVHVLGRRLGATYAEVAAVRA